MYLAREWCKAIPVFCFHKSKADIEGVMEATAFKAHYKIQHRIHFPKLTLPAIENHALKQQLRHQMNSSISEFGSSGTKVYSLDEKNLWADIESRLNILLDKKLGDKLVIDKSAALNIIWANKKRMREAKLFIESYRIQNDLAGIFECGDSKPYAF